MHTIHTPWKEQIALIFRLRPYTYITETSEQACEIWIWTVFDYRGCFSIPCISCSLHEAASVSSYKGYVFSIVPLIQLSGEVLTMVYTKGNIEAGMVEFDISTKKYKSVTAVERADKSYFIILIPKSTTISDSAIAQLESSKT